MSFLTFNLVGDGVSLLFGSFSCRVCKASWPGCFWGHSSPCFPSPCSNAEIIHSHTTYLASTWDQGIQTQVLTLQYSRHFHLLNHLSSLILAMPYKISPPLSAVLITHCRIRGKPNGPACRATICMCAGSLGPEAHSLKRMLFTQWAGNSSGPESWGKYYSTASSNRLVLG